MDPFFADLKFTVFDSTFQVLLPRNLRGTMHDFHAHEISTGVMCNMKFGQGHMTQVSPGNGIAGPLTPLPNVAINQPHKYVLGVYCVQGYKYCRRASGVI